MLVQFVPRPIQDPISTISAPAVLDLRSIQNPVERNNAINAWYHEIDQALTCYMGEPALPNWSTFGKHASHSVGVELLAVRRSLAALGDFGAIVEDIGQLSLQGLRAAAADLFRLLQDASCVASSPHVFGLATLFAANELRRDAVAWREEFMHLTSHLSPRRILGLLTSVEERASLGRDIDHLVTTVREQVSGISGHLRSFGEILAEGNLRIYEYLAPNFASFIAAAKRAPDGIPFGLKFDDDPSGYLATAFELYGEARRLSICMNGIGQSDARYATYNHERHAFVDEANFLLVYNEQLNRAQPLYDRIAQDLKAITRGIVVDDPSGPHHILSSYPGASWGNLYQRMGIDPMKVSVAHPGDIAPRDLYKMRLDLDCNHAIGTIARLFHQGASDPALFASFRRAPQALPAE